MDALTLLLNRRSASRLTTPAPNNQQLGSYFTSWYESPDHGALKPWHFVVMKEDGIERFSQLLHKAAVVSQLGAEVEEESKKRTFSCTFNYYRDCQS